MGKTAKMVKRSREAEAALSIETKLKGIFSSTDGEPAEKLIGASALWDELGSALESVPDFFAQVKPFVDSLDASDEQDKELKELYEEYAAKSGEALNDEIKELRSNKVFSKREAKELMELADAERKRFLFVRVLVIAMESAEGEEGDGEEQDGEEGCMGGPDINEEFIASLTEDKCAERVKEKKAEGKDDDEEEEEEINLGDNVAKWVCGLPTAQLQDLCEARGIEWKSLPTGHRLPLVQSLLRGMLEAEEEGEEEEGEEEDDDIYEDDDDDDDDDEEDEEEEEEDVEEEGEEEEGDDDDEEEDPDNPEENPAVEGPTKKAKTVSTLAELAASASASASAGKVGFGAGPMPTFGAAGTKPAFGAGKKEKGSSSSTGEKPAECKQQ